MKRMKNRVWKVHAQSTRDNEFKQIVGAMFRLNQHGADGVQFDVANVGWYMTSQQTYLLGPASLVPMLRESLFKDLNGLTLEESEFVLPDGGSSFILKGDTRSLNFNGDSSWLREILAFDETVIVTVNLRECLDHSETRDRIQYPEGRSKKEVAVSILKPVASTVWNGFLDAMWEKEDIEKFKNSFSRVKGSKKKPNPYPLTTGKLSEKNRYCEAQVVFSIGNRVEEFKSFLNEKIEELRGENELQVVPCEVDCTLLEKGHLNYDLPLLTLFQRELARFIELPKLDQETESKGGENITEVTNQETVESQLPESVYVSEPGAIPFARHLETNDVIHLPKAVSTSDLDDRVKPTLLVGEQGSGKTTAIVNNILETFYAGATNREEWKKYARSVICFDVADASIIADTLQHIPPWLMDRVKILNHSDTKNPIPVSLNDLAKLGANPAGIADMETKMLLDCLKDDSKTIAMERYFKHALQASYANGQGNILDAMHILISPGYREEVIKQLEHKNGYLYVELLEIHRELEDDKVTMRTIENRIASYRTDSSLMEVIGQQPSEDINFWRWMNGDEDGAYLVLIYLPKGGDSISEACRNFLFTHYYVKIWKLMLARESMDVSKRPETLVIVDEIHQVLGQRAVQAIFGDIFKEPRKYRVRYMFTFHGWSSIEEAGKKKESIIKSMKEAGCNLFLLKGGDEFFKSLSGMLSPYTVDDFNELMGMKYCGIFRFAVGKQNHVIQAKLLEPAEMRLTKYRTMSVEDLRNTPNQLGRPVDQVKKRIFDELKIMYENRPKKQPSRGKGKPKETAVIEY